MRILLALLLPITLAAQSIPTGKILIVPGFDTRESALARSSELAEAGWPASFIADPNRVTKFAFPITNWPNEASGRWALTLPDYASTNRLRAAERGSVVLRDAPIST